SSAGSESLDLYALATDRSSEIVSRFRERWLASFEESEVDYVLPQFADRPDAVYDSPSELIARLLAEPAQPHSLYWRNPRPGHLPHAMLFFTTDGGLIAGLAVATEDSDLAGATLRELAQSVDARYGYALGEAPPPGTASEFKEQARTMRILPPAASMTASVAQ